MVKTGISYRGGDIDVVNVDASQKESPIVQEAEGITSRSETEYFPPATVHRCLGRAGPLYPGLDGEILKA